MKKRTWMILITILVFIDIVALLFLIFSTHFAQKTDGSIPYNESNFYIPCGDNLLGISKDGTVVQYFISEKNEIKSIQKEEIAHLNYPVKKCISRNLFITEDDNIMFGDIRNNEHRNLGVIPNAVHIDITRSKTGNDIPLHIVVVTSDGLLYVQGDNSTGALGVEAEQVNGEFVQVPYLKNVVKAVCGINCIFVLNSDGEVFLSGTLGEISYRTFTKLEIPKKIKDIEASDEAETLIAMDIDGNVYEMGVSYFATHYYDYFPAPSKFYSSFHKIPKLKNISSVTISGVTAYAVDTNGKIFYWGSKTINKAMEVKKIFERIYGLPKHDKIWLSNYGNYSYVLSGNEITAYTW